MTFNDSLMIAGSLIWFVGEMIGVFSKRNMDTTSEWVWWAEAKIPLLRWVVATFFISLIFHFLFKTNLWGL